MNKRSRKIALLGVGNLGGAIARGLLRAGVPPQDLALCDVDVARVVASLGNSKVRVEKDPTLCVQGADLVVVCVKPPDVAPLLDTLAPVLAKEMTVVSAAAGVTLGVLRQAMGAKGALVRAMPNVNVAVGASMTSLVGEKDEPPHGLEEAAWLFGHVGRTVTLPAEKLMDAATSLAASGPAFLAAVLEGMMDGGVLAGLPRPLAVELALGMAQGTAQHLLEAQLHPGVLKDMVMSPGGTTAAGLHVLESKAVRGAMMSTVEAAAARALQLAKG